MSASVATARVARRELRRRPVTTLLIALLVALPVATMIGATVLIRTDPVPADIVALRQTGRAQAKLLVPATVAPLAVQNITRADPDVPVAEVRQASGTLTSPTGTTPYTTVVSGPWADPLVHDRFGVDAGHLPTAPGEIAVSPAFARQWDLVVGSRLDLPELGTSGTVVGIAGTVGARQQGEVFLPDLATLDPGSITSLLFVGRAGARNSAALAEVQRISSTGAVLAELAPGVEPVPGVPWHAGGPGGTPSDVELYVMWTWVGGALALVVMGIVISSAFAVGARRQLRTLGLLAANGASPRTVRAAVMWQGFWVGLAGTVIGTGLAVIGLLVTWTQRYRFLDYEPAGWAWAPPDLVPVAAIGIGAAVLSSYLPARSAARISVLRALAGRRPLGRVPAAVVIGGALAAAGGLVLLGVASESSPFGNLRVRWTAVAIVGGVAVLAGATALAPAVVGAAGALGGRLGGTGRLALRSIGRQRARFGAVVAGIAAVAALCVGASTIIVTTQIKATPSRPYAPADVAVVTSRESGTGRFVDPTNAQLAPIRDLLPGAAELHPQIVTVRWQSTGRDAVPLMSIADATRADPALLDHLGLPAAVRAELEAGHAVALGVPADVQHVTVMPGGAAVGGFAGVVVPSPPAAPGTAAADPGTGTAQPVVAMPAVETYGFAPVVLVPDAQAAAFGLRPAGPGASASGNPSESAPGATTPKDASEPEAGPTWFFTPAALTAAQADGLGKLQTCGSCGFRLASAHGAAGVASLDIATAGRYRPIASTQLGLLAAALASLLLTLGVISLGLALAARESRDERDVLEAVGAPPRLVRRVAAVRAGVLALLGALIAVPTGMLPVFVVNRTSFPAAPSGVPWLTVGLLVVVIPLIIAALALGAGAITSWRRPVSATTFAAD